MALFGFFALVLVSVYWINRAVLLFDKLISDGQTAWVVLEFTALTLPNAIRLVLPVAAFAATLYALNRLAGESELVVMQSAGASPWRLARPVAVFGLIVAALMLVLVHVLVPAAKARLAERQAQVSQDISAKFLTEGTFESPAEGLTLYIRKISDLGELLDLFLYDARTPGLQTIYTAEKALIVPSAAGPKLVMFDGVAQTLRQSDESLAQTRFSDFTYDLGMVIGPDKAAQPALEALPSWQLVAPDPALLAATGARPEDVARELHDRLAQPLMAPVAALLAAAAMFLGGFSRFGLWRQMAGAVVGLIALQTLVNLATSATRTAPGLWGLYYLPPLIGLVASTILLGWAARPHRRSPSVHPAPGEAAP
ncbi:lipopolysaccharide export system permease protein [Rhodobacter maris]|uniref:Lipopolysaccharide export system permease protein n=2 Tax=Rhodobacter maris TaxID=446682 RepID=A0A285RYH9_9RHOB|nr:lipopolysaccharide export system permease protein [Rhodobacter maris]